MTKWFKPEYCNHRNIDCDQCENYQDGMCCLTEVHRKLLEDVQRGSGK